MLGSFNNWDIIKLSHKTTPSEEIDTIAQVVLDGIINNMSSLLKSGRYGAINITYASKMGYYVITFMSEAYTLQEEKIRWTNKYIW